jgi:5-(carboxyamino)imidazole ribonucleotide mutase
MNLISIVMGSHSDNEIMTDAANILTKLQIPFEYKIVSAHRTPKLMFEYAETIHQKGVKVIIAGAGAAAHLPGMIAAITHLPVIGVPIKSTNSLDGWDSILSILQMPKGVPVATVALNNAHNAALLATQILATYNDDITQKFINYKKSLQNL